MKHLTTLSSGGALLVITLAEKLFSEPEWRFLVACSLIAFLVSVTSSLLMMFQLAVGVDGLDNQEKALVRNIFVCTLLSFCLGIYSIVVFAIKNFI